MQQPSTSPPSQVIEQVVGARPRAAAMSNTAHDLIHCLSTKLDLVWRYEKYIEDAERENRPECAKLFRQLEEEERRHVEQLRAEIEREACQQQFH